MTQSHIVALNPALKAGELAASYARRRRLQIANILTEPSAIRLHELLARETAWGLSWCGGEGPQHLPRDKIAGIGQARQQEMTAALTAAMQGRDFAFLYTSYPLVTAYLERWNPGSAQEQVLEEINAPAVLDFVRAVTGIPELVKADAQATLYAPNQFLSLHNDEESERGRRVAYVLSLCREDWRPDWGGYLNFFDDHGDIEQGFKPRFNTLNLFTVPQQHNVSLVPWFAPAGRYAITGWFRDR